MSDFIDIEHPKTDGTARVTERAFENVWKDKGWKKSSSKSSTSTTTTKKGS